MMLPSPSLSLRGVLAALLSVALPSVAVALLLPAGVAAADLQVYLVRHAEKAADDPRDPGLSAEGTARAAALAQALRHAGITTLYATQYRRTRATAAPLAESLGVEVIVRPASPDPADAAAFANELRSSHPGGAILVVGHSNTVPAIADALLAGAAQAPRLGEHDYDTLLLVTLPDAGMHMSGKTTPRLVVARYGAPAAH